MIVDDPRDTQSAIAGQMFKPLDVPEEQKPSAADTIAASFRQSNTLFQGYDRFVTHPDPDLPDAPPGWDALDHIQGYEDHASDFVDVRTPSELAGKISRLNAQKADREVLARSGALGTISQLGASILDPSFLAAAAVPEIALARGARAASLLTSATRGAAGATAYEGAMHALQEDRSYTESALNIGAGALLSGVLGSVLHGVPTKTTAKLMSAVESEPPRSEVGAAAAVRPTTLAEESIARGGATISKVATKIPLMATDLDKIMTNEFVTGRVGLQELADVPQAIEKNASGIATPRSVENASIRQEARVADFIDHIRDQWKEYRGRVTGDEQMSQKEFYESVAKASRRGDSIGIPEVDKSAQFLRARVFDPLKEEAQKLGLFKEAPEGSPLGAQSYFRRMYDREAIRGNMGEWRSTLRGYFTAQAKADPAEITAAIDDVTNKIMRADVGTANFGTKITVPAAGPLKERTLDVPDELIEKFLHNDPIKVASAYVRELAPQIELTKRFGDTEMTQQFQNIADEAAAKKVNAEQTLEGDALNLRLAEIDRGLKEVQEALLRVRNRVLGTAGRTSPDAGEGTRRVIKAVRGWRNFVASSKLGATALTGGLMDTAKIAAQYGFLPTMKNLIKLAANKEFRQMSKATARRVGSAVEVAMSKRAQVSFDGAITEGWTQKMADGVYKYTGLNHITDFNRTLAAVLTENGIMKAAAKVAGGGAISKFERFRLASLGIGDEELGQIAEAYTKHGGDSDGMRLSGSADWEDKRLADIYDAAILKESRIAVQTPGAADRVWWMDKETGKFFGQLKTFSLSSPARLLAAPFQYAGRGEYAKAARYMGFMMAGGYLTHAARQLVAGKLPQTDIPSAMYEAFTESGLGGILPDILSPITRRITGSVRYSDRNPASLVGGPAVGAFMDTWDALYNRTQGDFSASDLHAIRRLLPFQNVWWLRRAINALEGELAEGLNLKGSDNATVMQRLTRTDALKQ